MISDLQHANATEKNLVVQIVLIASAPVLLALCNTEWLYSPPGWIDPWVYLGYAFNYTDPTFQDDYYKISRLPWIITLFAAYHLFPPTLANHISHLGVFIATLIPFYLALRRLVKENGAMIATLLLAVYPYAHGSGGWDYHNAISGAFYCWAYYFLTVGWQSAKHDNKSLLIAGLFIGLLLHTNVLFLLFAPLMFIHFGSLRRGIKRKELVLSVALILCGVAVVTVALALINWSVGRQFLFFKPVMKLLLSFAGNSELQKPWWHEWSISWVSGAVYLSFSIAVLFASVVALMAEMRRGNYGFQAQTVDWSLYVQLCLAVAIWIIGQTAGHTFLDYPYFAYPLIFPAFSAFAGIASTKELKGEISSWDLYACMFLLVLPLAVGSALLQSIALKYFGFLKWNLAPSTILFLLACLLLLRSASRPIIISAVALLGIGNLGLIVDSSQPVHLSALEANRSYSIAAQHCPVRRHVFDTAIQFVTKLRNASMPLSNVVLWHSSEESLSADSDCNPITMKDYLAGPLYALGYGSMVPAWEKMPSISEIGDDLWKKWASNGKVIVVLTQYATPIIEIESRVGRLAIQSTASNPGIIQVGEAHLRMDMLKLQ